MNETIARLMYEKSAESREMFDDHDAAALILASVLHYINGKDTFTAEEGRSSVEIYEDRAYRETRRNQHRPVDAVFYVLTRKVAAQELAMLNMN